LALPFVLACLYIVSGYFRPKPHHSAKILQSATTLATTQYHMNVKVDS